MIPKMIRYASAMHGDQKRKKNGRPYFRDHCLGLLEDVCKDPVYGDDRIAHLIILGHDIVEDCTDNDTDEEREALDKEIVDMFGEPVAWGIQELTDEFTKARHPDMNRRERKDAELKRMSKISDRGKVLKLYDRRANLYDMIESEDWNSTYAEESWIMAFRLATDESYEIAKEVASLAVRLKDKV